jgi:hypothetical protein
MSGLKGRAGGFLKGNTHGHRWKPGESDNPGGVPKELIQFERRFQLAMAGEGTPEELARLIWKCARKGQAWALLKLAERLRFEWQMPHDEAAGDVLIKVVYINKVAAGAEPRVIEARAEEDAGGGG